MVKTELGIVRVGDKRFEFVLIEETSVVEVIMEGGSGVYIRGKLTSRDGTDLPEEFDDAVRNLLRGKPR